MILERGPVSSVRIGNTVETTFEVRVGAELKAIPVSVSYREATNVMKLTAGDEIQKLHRNVDIFKKSGVQAISILIASERLHLQAQLDKSKQQFELLMNETNYLKYDRYVEGSAPISARSLIVNGQQVLTTDMQKSLPEIKAEIDENSSSSGVESRAGSAQIEINQVTCNADHFIGLLETLLLNLNCFNPGKLRVLSLVKLPNELVIDDEDLLVRFGKSAANIKSLTLGDMRETKPQLKDKLLKLLQIMLDAGALPETIRLYNFGLETSAAEQLLDMIHRKGSSEIKELNLRHNPEFWLQRASGKCFDLLA